MITVNVTDITALLIGGDFIRVEAVSVDWVEFITAPGVRHARGLQVTAVYDGGPHDGDQIVVPLDRIDALRVS
jgi:hypothetical protein